MGKSRNEKTVIVEFWSFTGREARGDGIHRACMGKILRMRSGQGSQTSGPNVA